MFSFSPSSVAPVDHVRLERPIFLQVSSTPHEDQTCQPLPQYSVCPTVVSSHPLHLQPLTPAQLCSFYSRHVQHASSSPLPLYLALRPSFLCSCPSIIIESLLSAFSLFVKKDTRSVIFSGIKHTQPHRAPSTVPPKPPHHLPTLSSSSSSSVIKLSSFLPVFIPVNWALWWTVNKLVNHCYISENTTTVSFFRISRNKHHSAPPNPAFNHLFL